MNNHVNAQEQDVKIKAYQNGMYLSYGIMLKYILQLLVVFATGFGVYLTLKFNYVDEKTIINRSEIERLDKEKVDWKDYDRWIKLPDTIDKTTYMKGLVTENEKPS